MNTQNVTENKRKYTVGSMRAAKLGQTNLVTFANTANFQWAKDALVQHAEMIDQQTGASKMREVLVIINQDPVISSFLAGLNPSLVRQIKDALEYTS